MTIFSYIVAADTGFSPNPFHGICTLACCKPKIRKAAQKDDWVVGLSPKREGHGLVYAMHVEEKVSFEDYWKQERFAAKKPRFDTPENRMGDNIYEPLQNNMFKQHRSQHSKKEQQTGLPIDCENEEHKQRDLSGRHVLIARDFVYWGEHRPSLPPELLQELVVGRSHRRVTFSPVLQQWENFMRGQPRGIQSPPGHLNKTCHRCDE